MVYLVEGKYPLHAILSAAEKIVAQRTEGSVTLDPIAEAKFPKLKGQGENSRAREEGTAFSPVCRTSGRINFGPRFLLQSK